MDPCLYEKCDVFLCGAPGSGKTIMGAQIVKMITSTLREVGEDYDLRVCDLNLSSVGYDTEKTKSKLLDMMKGNLLKSEEIKLITWRDITSDYKSSIQPFNHGN